MKYSILVNTCDKFEDCWDPFFKLWRSFWPDCTGRVYLNTEFKDYSYPGVDVIPVKACEGKSYKTKYATWSQCLKWALDKIDTDIVLYLQEDYFLKGAVNNQIIEEFVGFMINNPEVKCVHLTDQGTMPGSERYDGILYKIETNQRYYVSCQAALWRKDELYRIIRERETAWEFEQLGSKRAKAYKSLYLAVDRTKVVLNKSEIIPYIFTGIVKGQWLKEVPALFEANNISVNYNIRGFWNGPKKKSSFVRLRNFLNRVPNIIKNQIELLIK